MKRERGNMSKMKVSHNALGSSGTTLKETGYTQNRKVKAIMNHVTQ
jgi:hypothetical protein